MQLASLVLASLCAFGVRSAAPSQDPPGQVTIQGSVVLADDARRAPEFGTFTLYLNYAQGPTPIEVDVKRGRWSIQVRGDFADIAVGRMRLEDRVAHCDREFDKLPATHWLDLEAHWVNRDVLHVVSKSSGVEFTRGIELVASENLVYPERTDWRVGRDLASPIELPEFDEHSIVPDRWRAHRSWWVRVAGYAWQRVDVDHAKGGTWTAELETGGDVLVTLSANEKKTDLALRLEHGVEIGRAASSLSTSTEPYVIESLAPGSYRIVVERFVAGATAELASRDAIVVAGKITELAFDLSKIAPTGNLMPLFGTLRVPSAWNSSGFAFELERLDGFQLRYQAIDTPDLVRVDGELSRWTAGVVPAGRYMAFIKPFLVSFVFDYDPVGASDFALVVPPPADVCVKLVDRRSHRQVTDENLGWYGNPPAESSDIVPQHIAFSEARGGYCFTAPVGDIVLCTSEADDQNPFKLAHIVAGANVIELTVNDYVRIRVFATVDGRRVAWPEEPPVDVRVVESGETRHARQTFWHRDYIDVGVDVAGRYRIELYDLFDELRYEPASVEVDALDDRIVEVEIPLKRRN